ncbi:ERF family protein [Thermoanaerobacterium sp. PSU-2]|uniref:ERF family protein n=1 Tax=Thermoanaerobacterium sp. PSU-2 TaxID=1930849 RepID=UPI000A159D08|nr:ERF family protein [Thermoanaerobacterium sp. PSU-2]
MNKSESIKEIATALAKFQGEVKNPANTATNPFLKNKYAPLNEILNVVRPILSKNGLSVIQDAKVENGQVIITTCIFHTSGEWIESSPLMITPEKMTAQGIGSIITYGRRYALSALLGISSEDDDDGNSQEKHVAKKEELITKEEANQLYALALKDVAIFRKALDKFGYKHSKDIKKSDLSAICEYIAGLVKANKQEDAIIDNEEDLPEFLKGDEQ